MKILRQFVFIFSICLIGIAARAQEEGNYFMHTVKTGQTLYSIANMYNVNVTQITRLNPGSNEMIFTGQILKIPQAKAVNTPIYHTVQAGETLYKLSQMYKVSINSICDLNPGLNAENFRSGEVIRIPLASKETLKPTTVEGINVTVHGKTAQPTTATTNATVGKYKEMHKVKRSETVYSICKKYKITEDELISANPTLKAVGLQKGDLLYIPYPTPAKPTPKIPTDQEIFASNEMGTKKIDTVKLAVLLPFKKDVRMVEYYEGMLLSIDSLKRSGISMDVYAYDLSNIDIATLLKEKTELRQMDVIFGPRDKEQIKVMADFAKLHHIRLVIPFNSKDNEVFSNPYIYMVNTPQLFLYTTVYNHFMKQFSNPNVIFIESSTTDKSKEQFVKGFKDFLLRNGVTYTSVSDGATVDMMSETLFSGRTNIFIPTSGTHVELIKILPKMELLKRSNRSLKTCLFGYPEWQTMAKEHLKQFFTVNTYFYASFYTNNLLPAARKFEKTYQNTYHKMMEARYPKYGMLGYDTGFYFLKGLATYGSHFNAEAYKLPIKSVQTGFSMKRVNNWGGFINQKVFFIHYTSNSEVEKNDFD